MKVKVDENLPATLVRTLGRLGHDAHTVHQEGLAGGNDAAVWAAAQAESRFFITQDLDFSDLRQYAPGSHHGLLLVRLRQPGRRSLHRRIRAIFESEPVENWKLVATDRKLRVRTPGRRARPPAP